MTADDEVRPGAPPIVHIGSTDGLVACVPYLVGFRPRNSLVVVFVSPAPRTVVLTLRVDADVDRDAESREQFCATIASAVQRARDLRVQVELAHLLVFAGAAHGAKLPCELLVEETRQTLGEMGLAIGEVLAADSDRVWHYRCSGDCCPGAGHPRDHAEAERAAFAMVMHGCSFVDDRQALVDSLVTDSALAFTEDTLESARRERTAALAAGDGGRRWRRRVEDELIVAMAPSARAPELVRTSGLDCIESKGALWSIALQDSRVREPVMFRLLGHTPADQRQLALSGARALLTSMVRRCCGPEGAPVAATLAAISWQQGDGAFARIAADRALAADPHNQLGQLIAAASVSGVPPRTWWEVLSSFGLARLRDGSDLPGAGMAPAV